MEHVHFERCTLRSKNFDMIVILKNFETVPISINAIPIGELDAIQEWLTDCTLTYTVQKAVFNATVPSKLQLILGWASEHVMEKFNESCSK